MAEQSRETEIRTLWKDYRFWYQVLGAILLVVIGVWIGRLIYADQAESYGMTIFTNAITIFVTVGIIDVLNRKRIEDQYKRQLVDDAASTSNEIAKNAVHQLRRKGWLEGENGLLKGVDLSGANLEGAELSRANLQGAYLRGARLEDAGLFWAELQNANLMQAKLKNALLGDANLQGANLAYAQLQGAQLIFAQLQGADLRQAKLNGANLGFANLAETKMGLVQYDVSTTFPDETRWIPPTEIDLRRFFDPTHHNFWRSDDPHSPAYRGKS